MTEAAVRRACDYLAVAPLLLSNPNSQHMTKLTNNSLALIALANEFCQAVEGAREAPTELVTEAVDALREDFVHYWSRTLCNVLRALNAVQTESADY